MSLGGADSGFYYDPLYGHVPIEPIFRQALNLGTMQRLRRLKQLATLDLVFPGATHTRFAHSVGVFYVATQIIHRLLDMQLKAKPDSVPESWPQLTVAHVYATQFAALFHDLGHGPFSHLFQMFCERRRGSDDWTHEAVSAKLITDGDVRRFLEDFAGKSKIKDDTNFLKPENIASMVQGKPPQADDKYLFLSQIVSGCPFDADRMDYLRRDAFYTGVDTGRVDIWSLVNNITLAKEIIPMEKKTTYALRIDVKAAISYEAFLFARDMMYRRVYYHLNHRANQELIVRAFHQLADKLTLNEMVKMTDEEIVGRMEDERSGGSSFTKRVARAIKEREPYETLPFDIKINDLSDAARSNWEGLVRVGLDKGREEVSKMETNVRSNLNLPDDEIVIFDLERLPLTKKGDYTSEWLCDTITGKCVSLLEACPHLNLTRGQVIAEERKEFDLGTVYLNMISSIYVHVPPRVIEDIKIGVQKALAAEIQAQRPPLDMENRLKKLHEALFRELDKDGRPLKQLFNALALLLQLDPDERLKLSTECIKKKACDRFEPDLIKVAVNANDALGSSGSPQPSP